MKIHYITMQFPAPSETFAASDIKMLLQKEHDVTVHSLRPIHPTADVMLKERGLETIKLTHNSIVSYAKGVITGLKNPVMLLQFLFWLISLLVKNPKEFIKSLILLPRVIDIFNEINKEKPDIVHLFWGHYPSLVGYLVQKHCPNTVVSIFLGAYDLLRNYDCSNYVASKADVIFTHSFSNLVTLEKKISEKEVSVVHRGINVNSILNTGKLINKKKFSIVTAGRLIQSKGMDDVVKVFSEAKKKFPSATLTILGDGPERENLEKLAEELNVKESVVFKGHVAHKEVFDELINAEVFLFMTKHASERLPNVVKEAMLCQCLCVTTHSEGIDELLVNGLHGFVVNSSDIKKASEIIIDFYANQEKYKNVIKEAHHQIENNFNVERQMEKYIKRWNEALGRRKGYNQ
ncbi:glycosyltransferase [Heliorestis acidaminivorans]|uniref:Glycosyltransferase n=1 Tax=Heliorestis acidaminivorans TaxID=553427 RepID=A0A6I0F4Z7_9FIRM|nr:glycosyltransferase [Heliorestis acidaminivorans]KAB2953757.1 glycosyltransferase [Heliorestis acidaminivorans]